MRSVSDLLQNFKQQAKYQTDDIHVLKDDIYTGYKTIDFALKEAVTELSPCQNCELWQQITSMYFNGINFKSVQTFFIENNIFKRCNVLIYDESNQFDYSSDIISANTISEGYIAKTTNFILLDSAGNTITNRNNYHTLYAFMPYKHKIWTDNTQEIWTDASLSNSFMIANENDKTLKFISVYKNQDYFIIYSDFNHPDFNYQRRSYL